MGRASLARISLQGATVVLQLTGPGVGQREAPIVLDEVSQALNRLGRAMQVLLIDLSNVRMMSSIGLGMCVELRHRAHAAGARTVIKAGPELAALFRMMKLDRLCIMAGDEAEHDRSMAA